MQWFDTPEDLPDLHPILRERLRRALMDGGLGRRMFIGHPIVTPPLPASAYRYFPTLERAEQFLAGSVEISTLVRCRNTEDLARGDPTEGTTRYHTGVAQGDWNDEPVRVAAQHLGWPIGPGTTNIDLSHNTVITTEPDCWVLCTSHLDCEELREKFGPFQVEISDLRELFLWIDIAMRRMFLIGYSELLPVEYGSRDFEGMDQLPWGVRIKDDDFTHEGEVRMAWVPWPHPRGAIFQWPVVLVPQVTSLLIRRY